MNKSVISLQNVKKAFKQGLTQVTVLNGINETFQQGCTYAITGASGAGKSTLLHIIAGLEAPSSGTVNFNQRDLACIEGKEKEQFFNKKLGLIFQLPYLINELTVLENVMLKGIIEGLDRAEYKKKAYILLEQLGIADKATSFPQRLSGGQQQRVAIARALLNQPAFLLADEPTGNLDEKTGRALIDLLLDYQRECGMGLIISSHDPYVTQKMEKMLLLKDGFLFHSREDNEHVKRTDLQL